MRLRTAVIPVAGLGTRFLPITKAIPKEMLPLVDRPIIEYIVEEAFRSGIEKIVFVNSRGKHPIEDYFDYEQDEIKFAKKIDRLKASHEIARAITTISIRQHAPKGLGHAILCARPAVQDEPFAVLLGDDVIDADPACTKQLIDVFEANGHKSVVGVMEVSQEATSKYGIVSGKEVKPGLLEVDHLVEKPKPAEAPSRFAIPGRYILTPDVFDILEKTKPSVGGEIQLTDALQGLANSSGLLAYCFTGNRYDAGNQVGFIEANIRFALKRDDTRSEVCDLIKRIAKDIG